MMLSLVAAALLYADVVQIDCPVASVTPAEREAFTAYVVEHSGGLDDPRFLPVVAAVARCRQRFGWSEEAAWWARMHAIGAAGEASVRRSLVARGIQLAALEGAIAADSAFAQAIDNGQVTAPLSNFIRNNGAIMDPIVLAAPESERVALVRQLADFITYYAVASRTRVRFVAG